MKTVPALLSLLLCLSVAAAITLPEGPGSFIETNASRRTPAPTQNITAQAGNVTQLVLTGTTVTQTWAGFYGNITGTITLDDAQNFTLYNWTMVRPQGEVYAADAEVTWETGTVVCYNYSRDNLTYISLADFESEFGIVSTDPDGINETFLINRSHRSFYAGGNYINGTLGQKTTGGYACPAVSLYNSTGQNDEQYQEVILYNFAAQRPFFASLIEQNPVLGFNNQYWDFEMILPVNNHNGSIATKDYYFYVELGP
ncbi:MAG: hypothetical protein V1735_08155 [Nanoarchaeota archaeon]